MGNLKILGLALTAAFAMFAVTASAASAQELGEITTSNGEAVTLTGTETGGAETNRVTAFGGFFECPGSVGTGHKYNVTPHERVENGATTITITPHVKEINAEGDANCKGPLGMTGTTDFNGCDYVVHAGETTGEGDTYGGTLDIVCPEGQEITWTLWTNKTQHTEGTATRFCTMHIPPQTGITGAHATDTDPTDGHIEITGTLEGIHIVRTESETHQGLLCANDETNVAKVDFDITIEPRNAGEPTISLSH